MRSFLFLHKMPFVRLLFPLLLGIVYGMYFPSFGLESLLLLVFGILLLFSFLLSFTKKKYRFGWTFGVLMSLCLLMFGVSLVNREKAMLWNPKNGDGSLLVSEVISSPEEKKSTVKCLVSFCGETSADSAVTSSKCLLVLYLPKDSVSMSLKCGDVLSFPDNLFRDQKLNPGEFDYAAYLRKKGISASLYIPSGKWRKIGNVDRFSLKSFASDVQKFLLDKIRKYEISRDEFGVLSAMVLGNREFMDSEIKNSYANTGASHILAVSGLHVGVVFFVFSFVLNLFWNQNRKRLFRTFLLLLVLWSYAFITGLPSSVVRASVMLSFVCVGMAINRKSSIYNTLAASAFFMLICHPFYLFDVGFQLSYMAVWSIVAFHPRIYSWFSFRGWLPDKIWSLFSVSLAAQIGTVPISLYYFHQFANYFWLSGFVVVPLSAVIIYLAIFLFVMPEVPFVCEFVVTVLKSVLWVMNHSIRQIEQFPYAIVSNIGFELTDVAFVFLIVILSFWSVTRFSVRKLQFLMLSLILYLGYSVYQKQLKFNREYFAVYNIHKASAVNCLGEGKNILFCNVPVSEVTSRISNFWIKNAVPLPEVSERESFEIGDYRVFCLRNTEFRNKITKKRLDVDVLVLSEDVDYTIEELKSLFHFRQLVLDSSNSWKYRKKMKKACLQSKVRLYDVVESGAFLLEGR